MPASIVNITDCVNHRHCVTNVVGSNKYRQYSFICLSCNVLACLSCAKVCHSNCKGTYVHQTSKCICADGTHFCQLGQLVPGNSASGIESVASYDFNYFPPSFLPPPYDSTDLFETLRYVEKLLLLIIG